MTKSGNKTKQPNKASAANALNKEIQKRRDNFGLDVLTDMNGVISEEFLNSNGLVLFASPNSDVTHPARNIALINTIKLLQPEQIARMQHLSCVTSHKEEVLEYLEEGEDFAPHREALANMGKTVDMVFDIVNMSDIFLRYPQPKDANQKQRRLAAHLEFVRQATGAAIEDEVLTSLILIEDASSELLPILSVASMDCPIIATIRAGSGALNGMSAIENSEGDFVEQALKQVFTKENISQMEKLVIAETDSNSKSMREFDENLRCEHKRLEDMKNMFLNNLRCLVVYGNAPVDFGESGMGTRNIVDDFYDDMLFLAYPCEVLSMFECIENQNITTYNNGKKSHPIELQKIDDLVHALMETSINEFPDFAKEAVGEISESMVDALNSTMSNSVSRLSGYFGSSVMDERAAYGLIAVPFEEYDEW